VKEGHEKMESRAMGRNLARSGNRIGEGFDLVSGNGVGTGFKRVRKNSKAYEFHTPAKRKHFMNVIEGYLAELKRMRALTVQ
jgi:hypothetical protein